LIYLKINTFDIIQVLMMVWLMGRKQ